MTKPNHEDPALPGTTTRLCLECTNTTWRVWTSEDQPNVRLLHCRQCGAVANDRRPASEQHPWPVDSTPGDMGYVAVCTACHGIAFVCNADDARPYIREIIQCVRRGHAIHRVPMTVVRNPGWYFCHGHHQKRDVPHGT